MAINIKPSHKGLLHEDLGVPQGKPIPAGKLAKAAKSKNTEVKKRAVFAENAKHFDHSGSKAKSAPQPHPETNPGFYDTEPHAPGNKIADKPLTPPPAVGSGNPKMVPKGPGRFNGVGGHPHQFGKAPIGGSHGFGHPSSQRQGNVRTSGHPSAHMIGKR